MRAPVMILTDDGQQVHDTINRHSRERNLHQATALGEEGIAELRRLLGRYRDAVTE